MGADALLVLCLALFAAAVSGQRPSAVSVGALFTYDSTIGRAARLAIELAVDDVNADPAVLAGTSLNLITQDTNCSGFVGTIEGQLGSLLLFLQFCYTAYFLSSLLSP